MPTVFNLRDYLATVFYLVPSPKVTQPGKPPKHEVTNFRCKKCDFTTTRQDKHRDHAFSKQYGIMDQVEEVEKEDKLLTELITPDPVVFTPTPSPTPAPRVPPCGSGRGVCT